jgi:hypothetical protein
LTPSNAKRLGPCPPSWIVGGDDQVDDRVELSGQGPRLRPRFGVPQLDLVVVVSTAAEDGVV